MQADPNFTSLSSAVAKSASDRNDSGSFELGVALRIENYFHIVACYGESAAERMIARLGVTFSRKFGATCVSHIIDGQMTAIIPCAPSDHFDLTALEQQIVRSALDATLGMRPDNGDKQMIAVLSVACAQSSGDMGDLFSHSDMLKAARTRLAAVPPAIAAPEDGARWRGAYRADMASTVQLLEDFRSNSVCLAWQPVSAIDESGQSLYYQAICAKPDAYPVEGMADLFSGAHRIGVGQFFEEMVLAWVIDELEIDPLASLGVQVSARSTMFPVIWDGIISRLSKSRDLASRLTVEFIFDGNTHQPCKLLEFAQRLRQFGCRIAISDFGDFKNSVGELFQLAPSTVKLARLYLQQALSNRAYHLALCHLIGLVKALGHAVVVTGVDDPELLAAARDAGADWYQGAHIAPASFSRSWRFAYPQSADLGAQQILPSNRFSTASTGTAR